MTSVAWPQLDAPTVHFPTRSRPKIPKFEAHMPDHSSTSPAGQLNAPHPLCHHLCTTPHYVIISAPHLLSHHLCTTPDHIVVRPDSRRGRQPGVQVQAPGAPTGHQLAAASHPALRTHVWTGESVCHCVHSDGDVSVVPSSSKWRCDVSVVPSTLWRPA